MHRPEWCCIVLFRTFWLFWFDFQTNIGTCLGLFITTGQAIAVTLGPVSGTANTTMNDTPVTIRLRKVSCQITLEYEDGSSFDLPFEYLRVFSPSAEVQGHGFGQGVLQTGKENVKVTSIEPVGYYAVRLIFDDGHDTGLYTWKYLYELGTQQDDYWRDYLGRLKAAGHDRISDSTGKT